MPEWASDPDLVQRSRLPREANCNDKPGWGVHRWKSEDTPIGERLTHVGSVLPDRMHMMH